VTVEPKGEGHLVYEQKIDLPYTYTAGANQRAALTGLREGRLVGARSGMGQAIVPAKPFGPDGAHLTELVDLPNEGTLEAVTLSHHLADPGDRPRAYGLIRIDGAGNLMLHRLSGGAEELEPGARVRAVWRSERSGSIDDVEHFEPA
jgi:uncharacterized OB-fold protein